SAKAPAAEPPPPPAKPAAAPPPAPMGRGPLAPSAPSQPQEPAPVRGESIFGKRSSGIRVLDAKNKRPAAEARKKDQDGGAKPPERRGPGVRFAAMPEVKQPAPSAKHGEER